MKVLVVGSSHHLNAGEQVEQADVAMFQTACIDIGKALGEAGIHLVIGSSGKHTADYWILQGVATVQGKHRVTILRPESGATPVLPTSAELPGSFEPTYKRLKGPWAAGRVSQILAADCVLMVGGSRGTAQVGHSAVALQHPVLAVPRFGGAAEEAWPQLEPFYDRLGGQKEKLGALAEDWHPSNAKIVVHALSELLRKRAFSRTRLGADLLPLGLNLILFSLWVWLFVAPPKPFQAAFFALLAVSAFLGTSLRNSLRIVLDPTERISRHAVVAELSAGLVLAFLLSLLYLAGSITFTGDATNVVEKPQDYRRIALAMGVLGVAGGWLLERVATVLSDWLLDRVPPKE